MMRLTVRACSACTARATARYDLPGAGGADAEGDDVAGDGVDVAPLAAGLGPDRAAPGRAQHLGGEHLGRALVGLHHVDGAADVGGVEALAPLEQERPAPRTGGPTWSASSPLMLISLPRTRISTSAERLLDEAQQLVALAEELHHQVVAGHEDLDLGRGHGGSAAQGYR